MATLSVGDPAPPFELLDQHGTTVRLAEFRGRKLLVYFYPKANTPGCTTQSCTVRDHREELAGLGMAAVGISPDPPDRQLAFDEKYSLGFPLLADTDHRVAKAWGAWGERQMYGKRFQGIIRSAFLIDEDGKVADAWYKVKPDQTVTSALTALGI